MAECLGYLVLLLAVVSTVSSQGSVTPCQSQKSGECVDRNTGCGNGYHIDTSASNYRNCYTSYSVCCVKDEAVFEDRSNCGKGTDFTHDRVLNGTETAPCNWPFVISIRSTPNGRTGTGPLTYDSTIHACGGVLIDAQWVLTSAYCVLSAGDNVNNARNRILVVAGEYNISRIDIFPRTGRQQEQLFNVDRAIINPNYRFTDTSQITFEDPVPVNSNGIALIKLNRRVVPNHCAAPACLPTEAEASADNLFYDNCRIFGWGFVKGDSRAATIGDLNILKMGAVQLSSPAACDYLTNLKVNNTTYRQFRPAGSTCLAPTNRLTDTCLGDEGGAVLCSTGKNWVVRGIQPLNMCVNNSFNLFVTRVGTYLQWIKQTMARY